MGTRRVIVCRPTGGLGIAVVTVSNGRAQLLLPPDPGSARSARTWVTALLDAWGRPGCRDAVRLVVTELVANAVVHARTHITLHLSVAPGRVRCAVSDSARVEPTPRSSDPGSPGGRGLQMVECTSHRWGVDRGPAGKTVWAEWTADAPGQGAP